MRYIVKPLRRHVMMPLLVVLQVALACAIACNALFLLQQRLVPILTHDGIDQADQLIVASGIVARGAPWSAARLQSVQSELGAIPGVTHASTAGSIPMVTNVIMSGDVHGVGQHTKANVSMYVGDGLVNTLGLKLVAGRDFSEQETTSLGIGETLHGNGPTIISQALATQLFPAGDALGKQIRIGDEGEHPGMRTVVGVVAHLMRNQLGTDNRNDISYTMLVPDHPDQWAVPLFAVRSGTADVDRLIKTVKRTIQRELGPTSMQGIEPTVETYASLRHRALARQRAGVWLLSGVCLVVLFVTLAGIMGLTGYWVQQRTRQIGVMRALGARRMDVLRDVQIENLLVVGVGVVIGLLAAYGINFWLMRHYELSRLPIAYLPWGALLMLLLGQLAVLAPALRAAAVPPVVATRSA